VPLDLHSRDHHISDVGIGYDIGHHLLYADVLRLARTGQRSSGLDQVGVMKVRAAGAYRYRALGIAHLILAGDHRPGVGRLLFKNHL